VPTNFVKRFAAGTIHPGFEGRVGCLIEIVRPVWVTHLGRVVGPGFTGKVHGLHLCREGTNVPVASASVNTTGGTAGQIKYAALTGGPVLVTPGRYDLLTSEGTGAELDPWYNSDTRLTRYAGAAAVLGACYYSGFDPGDDYRVDRGDGHTYGPVDFKFSPLDVTHLLTGYTPGTLNSAFTGWGGCVVETKSRRLRVTHLGRLALVGNNDVHTLRLVNLWTQAIVASVALDLSAGVADEEMRYAELAAPVTLEPFTQYMLLSSEVSGQDERYTDGPVTSETLAGGEVAEVVAACASTDGLTTNAGVVAGSRALGPVDFRCEIVGAPEYLHAAADGDGDADLEWPRSTGARKYRVESSADASDDFAEDAGAGTVAGTSSRAALPFTGSGADRYFRVVPLLEDDTEGPASPAACARSRPTEAKTLTREVSGLILRETFEERLGETAGLWEVVEAPSLVAFAPSRVVAAEVTDFVRDGTARQVQVIRLEDGRWFCFYDGAKPDTELVSDADRRNWASPRFGLSLDRGLTWQKYGPTSIFTRLEDDYGVTAGHAMGHFGVFDGKWIATLLRGATGDEALLTGPFLGDQFEADSPFGPWRWAGAIAPAGGGAGSFDDETNYPGSVVRSLDGSTYYLFLSQFKFSGGFSYSMSIATGASPTGPWSVPSAPLSIPGLTPGISNIVENLKVFYHAGLGRWVKLGNAGDGTSGTGLNRAWFSTSPTDWSAATWVNFQRRSALDAILALGVPSPVYKENGEAVVEADGSVPFTFDGNPGDGNHYYRRGYYGVLEASKNALEFDDTSGTVSSFPFEVAHEDEFTAEFAFEVDSFTAGGFVAFDLLMDADGSDGYRVKVAAGGVASLYSVAAGVETLVEAGAGTNTATKISHRVAVVVRGGWLVVLIDGQMQATAATL
jgi:hypothetical protein